MIGKYCLCLQQTQLQNSHLLPFFLGPYTG